jgi:hypothetical protein
MKFNDEELQSLWQQNKHTRHDDCLSAELLVRAGADELNANERLRITQHLSDCANCAKEYRIARATKDWAAEAVIHHPEIFPARPVVTTAPQNWWRRIFPSFGFRPLTAGLTAAFLLLSVGLGWWLINIQQQNRTLLAELNQQRTEAAEITALRNRIEELQRPQPTPLPQPTVSPSTTEQDALKAEIAKLKNELARLTRPQLDVPQIDVDPQNETRGVGNENKTTVTTVQVPASAEMFTINLPGAGSKPFPSYLLELYDAKTNKLVWSGQRQQDNDTTFTLTLAKRNFSAGKYRIKISGMSGKKKELISTYDFQLK